MSKNRDVQKRMAGTYDPPVPAVQEKAEEYAGLLRTRMETQRAEDLSRGELIELMRKHDVKTCEKDIARTIHKEESRR